MTFELDRRSLLLSSLGLCPVLAACGGETDSGLTEEAAMALGTGNAEQGDAGLFFELSLAQWSLHRALWAGKLDHLDFPARARSLGFGAVEYVNTFFLDRAEDSAYLDEMNRRAADAGVKQLLIMVDAEGSLADADNHQRGIAVDNHRKWLSAAARLGCHSIRVNAQGKGDSDLVAERAVESLGILSQHAAEENLNVLVENHGGYSSNGAWLSAVIGGVDARNCGTLPDFGNFTLSLFPPRHYDRYQGLEELMPWAKGVSAKSYDFNARGEESSMDYQRLLTIVADANYRGYIGVEYEGSRLSEEAGILATAQLLRRVGAEL